MKKRIKVLGLMIILLTNFSCIKEFDESTDNQAISETNEHRYYKNNEGLYIVLGKKKEIAYTVENMQKAVRYINEHNNNSKYINRIIKPTHYYIKFMPNNDEHLRILDEIDKKSETIVLSSYPLDYEIIQQGSFLNKSKANDIKYSELYTTVPIDYIFPNVPYKIIEEVYQPKETEDDMEIVALILSGNEKEIEINYMGNSLTINNLPDFLNNTSKGRWRKYRPYGYFKVEDTNTDPSSFVGVRNTKVSIGRGIWWRYTYTNSAGKFVSPKKYRGTVYVRAKWRSESATIRKHWNELIGIGVSDYLMHINKSINGRWYLTRLSDNHKWYKATVQNSIIKYNNYIQPKGVVGIHGANIWVRESDTKGMTAMLHKYTWTTTASTFFHSMLVYTGFRGAQITSLLNTLVGHLYPDMILDDNHKNTKKIDQLVFHESGHFSHAIKAGGWFWGQVVGAELDNILYTINSTQDPYRDGSKPTINKGRLIALAEGWATFTEYAVMNGYYTTDCNNNNIVDYMENFDMYTVPMSVPMYDNRSWFLSGLIWDVIDNHYDSFSKLRNGQNNSIINNISDPLHRGNISSWYAPVFNRLTNSVSNGYELKVSLQNTYPSSTNQINQLFQSYGY